MDPIYNHWFHTVHDPAWESPKGVKKWLISGPSTAFRLNPRYPLSTLEKFDLLVTIMMDTITQRFSAERVTHEIPDLSFEPAPKRRSRRLEKTSLSRAGERFRRRMRNEPEKREQTPQPVNVSQRFERGEFQEESSSEEEEHKEVVVQDIDTKKFLKAYKHRCQLWYGQKNIQRPTENIQRNQPGLWTIEYNESWLKATEPAEGWSEFIQWFSYPWVEAFSLELDYAKHMSTNRFEELAKSLRWCAQDFGSTRGCRQFSNLTVDVIKRNSFPDTLTRQGNWLDVDVAFHVARFLLLRKLLKLQCITTPTFRTRRDMFVSLANLFSDLRGYCVNDQPVTGKLLNYRLEALKHQAQVSEEQIDETPTEDEAGQLYQEVLSKITEGENELSQSAQHIEEFLNQLSDFLPDNQKEKLKQARKEVALLRGEFTKTKKQWLSYTGGEETTWTDFEVRAQNLEEALFQHLGELYWAAVYNVKDLKQKAEQSAAEKEASKSLLQKAAGLITKFQPFFTKPEEAGTNVQKDLFYKKMGVHLQEIAATRAFLLQTLKRLEPIRKQLIASDSYSTHYNEANVAFSDDLEEMVLDFLLEHGFIFALANAEVPQELVSGLCDVLKIPVEKPLDAQNVLKQYLWRHLSQTFMNDLFASEDQYNFIKNPSDFWIRNSPQTFSLNVAEYRNVDAAQSMETYRSTVLSAAKTEQRRQALAQILK